MKYVGLIGFVISLIVWIAFLIQNLRGKKNMLAPMWISLAFIWIFTIVINFIN